VTLATLPPVSCRLELLPGRAVAEQLAAALELGFDGVALPGRYLETWLPELQSCRADSPVRLAGISLGFKGSLLSPHAGVRRDCRDSLLRLLDLCAELQAGWINVPPCLIQDQPERLTDAGGFNSLRDRLDALLLEQLPDLGDAARDRGLLFLLEPVNRYESDYLNSIEHAARLCRQLGHPAIGCTADFFHLQLEELDPPRALEQASPFVRHVHTAGNTRAEPGAGSLDLKPGFRALKAGGYAGWLEIECRQLTGPARDVLPKAAHHLRTTWTDA
jgi:sugar phosphate isomerase/epimerase